MAAVELLPADPGLPLRSWVLGVVRAHALRGAPLRLEEGQEGEGPTSLAALFAAGYAHAIGAEVPAHRDASTRAHEAWANLSRRGPPSC